ncbi:MAG: hypothetical protein QM619_17120 [Micropruina sp.]|uniref:hypothetical protein n=1 Tax=Micropruina sp. TaxID=2737536 RepID=UPI0039E36ACC
MSRDEPDDTRFEELMAREFPGGLVPDGTHHSPVTEPPSLPEPPRRPHQPGPIRPVAEASAADLPSDFRGWTAPEEPDEPFTPPPALPRRPWTAAGTAGTALVVLPLVLVLAAAFGVRFPIVVSVLAGLGFFVGVVLLLYRLRQRPPIDGDGAVV